jgi:hypothetical protein
LPAWGKGCGVLAALCAAGLAGICIPLLVIACYNFPSADDFSYSVGVRHMILSGGSVWSILCAAAREAADTWHTWQGSYSAAALMALQPGVWGESFYALGTWSLLGSLLASQGYLLHFFLCRLGGLRKRFCCIVWALVSGLQILFVPYPNQAFYWFNGSVYYTFFYSLSLVWLTVGLKLLIVEDSQDRRKRYRRVFSYVLTGFLLGGGNLATGLGAALGGAGLLLAALVFRRSRVRYLLPGILAHWVGFGFNVVAPGNQVRFSVDYSAEWSLRNDYQRSFLKTVLLSLEHAALNIVSWTDWKVVLILLLIAPLLWAGCRRIRWDFRFPLLFGLLLFGIYASQLAPSAYVDGSYGPPRMGDIIWDGYCLLLVATEAYFFGWLQRHFLKLQEKLKNKIPLFVKNGYLPYFAVLCVLYLLLTVKGEGYIYQQAYKDMSVYQACRSLYLGEAQAYAAEWEERLAVLNDPDMEEVSFKAFQNRPILLVYIDIQEDSRHSWINAPMAEYYGKRSISLIPE